MPLPVLKNKAQLHMGETIMVLIIVVIIGIVAFVFYVRMTEDKIQGKLIEIEELNAVETAQLASSLYELRCSKPGVTDLCFDIHKALALQDLRTTNPTLFFTYYYDLFGDAKITLQRIYPADDDIILYDNNAGTQQTVKRLAIPVPLHNSSDDTTTFGILIIEKYSQQRGIP